ncbi:MAG: Heptaprenyl diphosphate synthase component 2 [Syntrophomonadaceae bacterium]|nr:Heptaprenyl diphosphate synthase component 2 [Bacillota bacterium]
MTAQICMSKRRNIQPGFYRLKARDIFRRNRSGYVHWEWAVIHLTVYQMPLTELHSLDELRQVEERLWEICRGDDSWTPLFSGCVTQGGKRLRPALVVLCGSFRPASRNELVDVATAAELIHNASLVHDDVIDRAQTRRGMPTLSARWGEHQAVLYGDFLFARAFSLLTKHGRLGILENMTKAISLMCEGEITQLARRFDHTLTEADYLTYIHKKTACFLSACCLAGAGVCRLPSPQRKLLAAFGLQLGYAFQMTDDLLDFCGTPESVGKPVFHDLTEGCITLPVIRLLQQPLYGSAVRHIIERREFDTENIEFIRGSLEESGILTAIRAKAKSAIFCAKRSLAFLPNGLPRTILAGLADHVLQRNG